STLRIDLTTDVDYTDPALSYLSTGWQLEYATCAELMNYPDVAGGPGGGVQPGGGRGFSGGSGGGRTVTVYDPERSSFLERRPARAGRRRVDVQPRAGAGDAIARRPVCFRHHGHQCQRRHGSVPARTAGRELPRARRDAVLLHRPGERSDHAGRRPGAADGGAVFRLLENAQPGDRPSSQPLLHRHTPRELRRDRLSDRQLARRDGTTGEGGDSGLRRNWSSPLQLPIGTR